MPKYISLVSFTQEGIKNVKETGKRAMEFADKVKKKGIVIKETLWTLGRYDIIHIFEAPDDRSAASLSFALSSIGNVRTETTRVFEADEMTTILGDVYEIHAGKGTLK